MRVHICSARTPAGTDLTLTLTQVLGPTGRESKFYPRGSHLPWKDWQGIDTSASKGARSFGSCGALKGHRSKVSHH